MYLLGMYEFGEWGEIIYGFKNGYYGLLWQEEDASKQAKSAVHGRQAAFVWHLCVV